MFEEAILKNLAIEAALKEYREHVLKLIDEMGHLHNCQTKGSIVGACCNCGLQCLKDDIDNLPLRR